ncbi:MAG: glycosyltransferase family 2 protein [Anaerolineae bacterium]|nr:glycosyltransferase family 2 protein [Anaerolineae bacterium]
MSRTLIILTLNEIEGVRAFIPILSKDVADEIIAVDGGSTDGTREFLQEYNIPIFDQTRRGRGEAFRVGVANSSGEFIVFFSPDGNEDPDDIAKLFELLEAGADIAIASRFLPDAQNEEDDEALPLRKWVNQAFTLLANLNWNRGRPYVTDTINGYRGIRRAVFDAIAPSSMGYTIEYEMTIAAMRAKLKIVEIPTIEQKRIGGETKGASWPTGVAFLRFFLSEVKQDIQPYASLFVGAGAVGLALISWAIVRRR